MFGRMQSVTASHTGVFVPAGTLSPLCAQYIRLPAQYTVHRITLYEIFHKMMGRFVPLCLHYLLGWLARSDMATVLQSFAFAGIDVIPLEPTSHAQTAWCGGLSLRDKTPLYSSQIDDTIISCCYIIAACGKQLCSPTYFIQDRAVVGCVITHIISLPYSVCMHGLPLFIHIQYVCMYMIDSVCMHGSWCGHTVYMTNAAMYSTLHDYTAQAGAREVVSWVMSAVAFPDLL